jgi:colanic acid biosynthesis glycosyl transferase WcaI
VTIVPEVVGVVHPCKIYGAMAVRRSVLLVGPEPSHVSDLVEKEGFGWRVDYGDTDRLIEVLDEILATDPAELKRLGEKARTILEARFSHKKLFGDVADLVENMCDR